MTYTFEYSYTQSRGVVKDEILTITPPNQSRFKGGHYQLCLKVSKAADLKEGFNKLIKERFNRLIELVGFSEQRNQLADSLPNDYKKWRQNKGCVRCSQFPSPALKDRVREVILTESIIFDITCISRSLGIPYSGDGNYTTFKTQMDSNKDEMRNTRMEELKDKMAEVKAQIDEKASKEIQERVVSELEILDSLSEAKSDQIRTNIDKALTDLKAFEPFVNTMSPENLQARIDLSNAIIDLYHQNKDIADLNKLNIKLTDAILLWKQKNLEIQLQKKAAAERKQQEEEKDSLLERKSPNDRPPSGNDSNQSGGSSSMPMAAIKAVGSAAGKELGEDIFKKFF